MTSKEDNILIEIEHLYVKIYGVRPEIEKLPGAGSDRAYYRVRSGENRIIATFGNDIRENRCFIGLSKVFGEAGVNVPEILGMNESMTLYFQEDLGEKDLLSYLGGEERMTLSAKALAGLVRMQLTEEGRWKDMVIHMPFSRRMVMWDLNYFKYEFLKPAGIIFDEEKLEDDFENYAGRLIEAGKRYSGFMYRDFQSRNVMIKDSTPGFIDYQGGRKGPIIYDAVSFLWQAKAGFRKEEREELLETYIQELERNGKFCREAIERDLPQFVLFRTLQVLGAYGFRGLIEKKSHFIESIPGALSNLEELLDAGVCQAYPEIERVGRRCVESRYNINRYNIKEQQEGLTIKVFSFSYKKGYPEDLSGNGGGFMFDCRGMHNPGRYVEYKPLTGLDLPVIKFLEEKGEVQEFIKKGVEIVTPSVARYLQRGFTGLQVGFGCTGGRHRSVYCAEGFAKEIKRKFPEATVELIHREQGIRRII